MNLAKYLGGYRHPYNGILLVCTEAMIPFLIVAGAFIGVNAVFDDLDETFRNRIFHTDAAQIPIYEQYERAKTIGDQDVLFLGDSSCLMGVASRQLKKALPGYKIENLCSTAAFGPAGYAMMLEEFFIKRKRNAKAVIFIFHPEQFNREPSWDGWIYFIQKNGFIAHPGGLRFLPTKFFESFILENFTYTPMSGTYGLYYGGRQTFRSIVQKYGAAVDPSGGLEFTSFEEMAKGALNKVLPKTDRYSYKLTKDYLAALEKLSSVIGKIGRDKFYLTLAPIPKVYFDEAAQSAYPIARRKIRTVLGLSESNFIDAPKSWPNGYFSTGTHLNYWGREKYTALMENRIRKIMSHQ